MNHPRGRSWFVERPILTRIFVNARNLASKVHSDRAAKRPAGGGRGPDRPGVSELFLISLLVPVLWAADRRSHSTMAGSGVSLRLSGQRATWRSRSAAARSSYSGAVGIEVSAGRVVLLCVPCWTAQPELDAVPFRRWRLDIRIDWGGVGRSAGGAAVRAYRTLRMARHWRLLDEVPVPAPELADDPADEPPLAAAPPAPPPPAPPPPLTLSKGGCWRAAHAIVTSIDFRIMDGLPVRKTNLAKAASFLSATPSGPVVRHLQERADRPNAFVR